MPRNFCLLKEKVDKFKEGLRSGDINPAKLTNMTSKERSAFLADYVGESHAQRVNAEFESKLLLKNQEQGLITWAKSVTGITPNVKRDLIQRIKNMDRILSPEDGKSFFEDLASTRLGVDVTETEMTQLHELSTKVTESEAKWQSKIDENQHWNTDNSRKVRKEWLTDKDRLEYGLNVVGLKNYVDGLKLEANKLTWRKDFGKKLTGIPMGIGSALKSSVASFDNSFFGRQGLKVLLDPRKTGIWASDFLKSWKHIGKQLVAKGKIWTSGDDAVMDMIKADIMSRPNALNGKYKAGGYGLDVLSEEAYPSSLPEKIPLFGRVFKASEVAYNGGALQMRADLADRFIQSAEKHGVNTSSKEEAKYLGNAIGSMTGRGSLGKGEIIAKEANAFLFSIKFAKANIDTLLAPAVYGVKKLGVSKFENAGEQFARKEAATNTLSIIATIAALLTAAALHDPDSVELDPRSTNFGKVKMWGHWTDISGGMAGYVTLATRLVPTFHDGKWSLWTKSTSGKWTDLLAKGKNGQPVFGQQTAMDVFDNWWQGKLSPLAGIARDAWKGQTYSGDPITPGTIVSGSRPIPFQNYEQMSKDPNSSFIIGSMVLDGLGFSVGTNPEANTKSGYIRENEKMSNENFIDAVAIYAQAFGADPETAFNRMFTGQKIRRVDNGTIIVERMSLKDSTAVKKKANADNPTMKLDHTIPLELGGSNDQSNLKLVTTSEWSSYTAVENHLGKALKAGKVSKQEAQKVIVDFKNGDIKKSDILEWYN